MSGVVRRDMGPGVEVLRLVASRWTRVLAGPCLALPVAGLAVAALVLVAPIRPAFALEPGPAGVTDALVDPSAFAARSAPEAFAAPFEFDPATVISDAECLDVDAMSASDVQAFLDAQPGTLKSFVTADHAGVQKTAAVMISDAASAWSVSPRVILVTLQKEQSLIANPAPTQNAYDWACGVGKTDSGTLSQYKGFGNQIWYAAKTLADRRLGWSPIEPLLIDGTTIFPTNASTYALYIYTPHLSGVQLFWNLYWQYFGDPRALPPGTSVGALTGSVTEASGGPLAGVAVSVSDGPTALTGADGSYLIPRIASGSHAVMFSKAGYAAESSMVVISADATTSLYASLSAVVTTGTLSGKVTVDGGGPLSGVRVSVSGGGSTTTAADGSYTIRNASGGNRSVSFVKSGYVTRTTTALVSPGETTMLDVSLVQCGNLSGKVTNSAGTPVSGVKIWLSASGSHIVSYAKTWLGVPYLWGGTSREGVDCSGLTQAAGSEVGYHSFPRTAADQWAYFKVLGWTVSEPRAGDLVYFESPSSPSGYHTGICVSDATILDAPGSGKAVRIEATPSLRILGYGRFQGGPNATTTVDGTYSFRNLEPGTFSVGFSAPGYARQTPEVPINPGTTTQYVAELAKCGAISGTVASSDGSALSGVSITIAGGPTATTSINGAYSITGLEAATYTVTFAKTGYLSSSRTVSVSEGATATLNASLALRPVESATTSLTIRTSRTRASYGAKGAAILSGLCQPSPGLVGLVMHVNVKKPQRATWTYSSNRVIYSNGGQASWWYRYVFLTKMPRGTYYFMAIWDGNASFKGSRSSVVTVRL